MMNNIQEAETQQQRAQIERFYKAKYPDSIGNGVKPEAEDKLSPQERQDANQRFSDSLFRANQQANNDVLSKLRDVFKARKAGAS